MPEQPITPSDPQTNQPAPPISPETPPVDTTPTPSQPEETAAAVPAPSAEVLPQQPAVSSEPTISAAAPPEQPPVAPTTVHKGKKGRWLLLILVLLLIAAGVGGYLYHTHHHKATVAVKQDIPLINYGVYGANFSTMYPQSVASTSNVLVDNQLFEGLVQYSQQTKVVPGLSTGWVNPDTSDWIFTLRKGVTFNTGRPLTAEAVKDSLDYDVAHQGDQNGSLVAAYASTIKSVTVVDTNHVKITTNGPDPTLLNRLAELLIFDTKAPVGDPAAGTGPYVLKPGTKLSDNEIDLTASNTYWGGHVYTREIDIKNAADQATLAKETDAGTFSMAGIFTNGNLKTLKNIPGIRVSALQDYQVHFIGLNANRADSPLHSLAGRQAVAAALNVPAIVNFAGVQGEQASQLIPKGIPGYNPAIQNTPYNLAKAKQLLASVPNATAPVTLSYESGSNDSITEIAKELTAAGFNIKLQPEPDVNTLVGIGLSGKTDMFYAGYGSDIYDGLDIMNSVVLGNADYSSDALQALADKASSTLDATSRISLLQQMEQQVANDVPDVPVYVGESSYVVTNPAYHFQSDVPGAELGVYFWKTYQ